MLKEEGLIVDGGKYVYEEGWVDRDNPCTALYCTVLYIPTSVASQWEIPF